MKRIITALIIGACSVMIVGCGTQNTNAKASGSESITVTTESKLSEIPESEETSVPASMSENEVNTDLMVIEEVFVIKDHGVIITGILDQGTINIGDLITINGDEYAVFMIDAVDADTGEPCSVNSAEKGMSVALHLSTMDSGKLKQGDIVKLK